MLISGFCARFLSGCAVLLGTPMLAHAIAVTSTTPIGNTNNVARNASIQIDFDSPLATATITSSSFRVWGTQSGPAAGATVFSNGDQTLTFTPSASFFPGEWISIQLAHSIEGADSSSLRSAGFAFQFQTRTGTGSMQSTEIDVVSVSLEGETTRLYGGAITDLNRDGWIDYIAVNEISHDLRVLLNRADGSGLLGPVLTPPTPIGSEASPSTVADFDNDGLMDVATGNSESNTVSVALGSGDGHFASVQNLDVGIRPHGIVALDVDGDGDLDIVVASENSGMLTLLVNDGQGVFGGRVDFANQDGDGKYALGAGDMNGDGILDLVVGTSTDDRILVLKGNGDGTFTQTANIAGGGYGWKLTLGDVNNDGKLDVAQANGPNNSGSIVLGNGDGTLQAATIYGFGGTMVGSALGDLDGDGYLDWVVSSYGAGAWYVLENDHTGAFNQVAMIPAPSNASCASLYDFDNDGTLDMALADEVSDEIVLMKNDGAGTVENADIAVTMSVDTPVYAPGEALTFTLTVANNGPDASNGTHIVDTFPPEFLTPTWTCVGAGGASGSGDIDRTVDLASGGQVVCTILGFSSEVSSSITNTATASVTAPVQDPVASNNSATVTATAAGNDTIFAAGFE